MSFSQRAGCAFLPLLSRLVLGSAFLFAGWFHCFGSVSYSGSERSQIESFQSSNQPAPTRWLVAWQDSSEAPAAGGSQSAASGDGVASSSSSADASDRRPAVYRIALDLQRWGVTQGVVPLAWGLAVFEIVAGALVLLGLFTRLWGGLLAVLIGASFAMSNVQAQGMFEINPFAWRQDPAAFYDLYFHASGFVLALGLLLVGSGVLALDSVVFKRREPTTAAPAKPAA